VDGGLAGRSGADDHDVEGRLHPVSLGPRAALRVAVAPRTAARPR
jgi:hypothetical protein